LGRWERGIGYLEDEEDKNTNNRYIHMLKPNQINIYQLKMDTNISTTPAQTRTGYTYGPHTSTIHSDKTCGVRIVGMIDFGRNTAEYLMKHKSPPKANPFSIYLSSSISNL